MGSQYTDSKTKKNRVHFFSIILLGIVSICLTLLPQPSWAVPNAPSNLTATVISSSRIDLAWTDNSDDESGFVIERRTATGSYLVIGSVGPGVNTYSNNTDVIQTTEYFYRVRARSDFTYSAYSNEVTATALPMNPPTDLSATVVSSSRIDLAWTDNSDDESGFWIERRTATGSYSLIGSVGPGVQTYSNNTSVIQTTEYFYRVRARSDSTYSAYSNEVTATALPMNPPTGLSATVVSSSRIDLAWTDNSDDESGFWIERRTATGSYSLIGSVSPGVQTYSNNTSVIQTTEYFYRIRARSGSTYSAYSNEVTATALPMNPPTDLSATVVSSSRIDLAWTDNSDDESGFSIERRTATGSYSLIGSVSPGVQTYSNTNLTQTEYVYRVRARSGSTYSAYSNEASTSADVTPPTGSLMINSGAAFTHSTLVTLTLSATDDTSGVAEMQFSNDNITWSAAEPYITEKSWTLTAVDGTKTVYAKFKDVAGNWSTEYSSSIVLDTVGPEVTIISPVAGLTNNKTPLLNYTVSDGVFFVKVDGSVVSKVSGSMLDPLSDGPHTVRVESTDAAGNVGSAEVSFTVVTAPPSVTISLPVSGFTNINNPLLAYDVSEGTVTVKVDGVAVSKTSGDTLDALSDGPHTLRVESMNAAGQTGFAEVIFTVDTEPPLRGQIPRIAQLAAGGGHSLAVTVDRVLWAWGSNASGCLGDETGLQNRFPEKIGSDHTWEIIAAGESCSLAIKSDGTLWAWGSNYSGQLGDGTTDDRYVPVRIGADSNWQSIFTSGSHSLALKADGTLWAWGANWYGQLGDGTTDDKHVPLQVGVDASWTAISAGRNHTLALKSDGTLWAWGSNLSGQLGDGTTNDKHVPMQVGTDADWVTIAAGSLSSIALKSDGSLWAWGANWYGQLGDGTTDDKYAPVRIGTDTNWQSISTSGAHSLALKADGTLWAWGANWYGQLGDGTTDDKHAPVRIGTENAWSSIMAQGGHSMALTSIGTVWTWGANWSGQLGDGTSQSSTVPHVVDDVLGSSNALAINGGGDFTNSTNVTLNLNAWDSGSDVAFMKFSHDGVTWFNPEPYARMKFWTMVPGDDEKTVYVMFQDAAGNWSAPFSESIILDTTVPIVNIISPGPGFTNNTSPLLNYIVNEELVTDVVLVDGEEVDVMSDETLGPLEVGSHTVRVESWDDAGNMGFAEVTFTIVEGAMMVSITSPASGATNNATPLLSYSVNYGTVKITVDGVVVNKASGSNLDILSEGPHTIRVEATDAGGHTVFAEALLTVDTEPPFTTSISSFSKLAAGDTDSLGITIDGNLWWWGTRSVGSGAECQEEVCDRYWLNSPIPQSIGMDHRWSLLSAAQGSYFGMKSDGTIWGWGQNQYGQLGEGTTNDIYSPYQIGTDIDWLAVTTGGRHTVALKTNGTLWTWGNNEFGTLGDGTTNDHIVPVQVETDSDWIGIAAGGDHTLAVNSDGTLWAWGANWYGQLGNGSTSLKRYPVRIGYDYNWVSVTAGYDSSYGLKSDGSLWAWGANERGQLGVGSTYTEYSPVQIESEIAWTTIAVSGTHVLGLKVDGTLWAWGENWYGQVGDGTAVDKSVPVQIGTENTWSFVSAGGAHSLALKSDGTLWTWGSNEYGQLGDGTMQNSLLPHLVNYTPASGNVILINNGAASTSSTSVTLTLNAWDTTSGVAFMQLSNDGTTWSTPEPYTWSKAWALDAVNGTKSVFVKFGDVAGNWSSPYSSTIVLSSGPPVVTITSPTVGFTENGQPLLSYSVNKEVVTTTVTVDGVVVNKASGDSLDVLADGLHIVRVDATDANGYSGFAEVTFTVDSIVPVVTLTSPLSGLTANNTPLLIYSENKEMATTTVKVDGVAVNKVSGDTLDALIDGIHKIRVEAMDVYGYKCFAEISLTIDTQPPSGTVILKNMKIEAGDYHSAAIALNGTLWTWGGNQYGRLGDGTTENKSSPTMIGADADWTEISAGSFHSVGRKSDGTLWAWGENSHGQLGDGTDVDKFSPVRVGIDTDWAMISAGGSYTAGLKTDGTLWTWGGNWVQQLGDGQDLDKFEPFQIASDRHWSAISAGAAFAVALNVDGSLWSWGNNYNGQLGEPRPACDLGRPDQIETDMDWIAISAGGAHVLALKSNGTLWAWGANGAGQVGDGTTVDKFSPTPIGSDTDWVSISAGGSNSAALKSDGTLWAWGIYLNGQLPDCLTENLAECWLVSNVPVQIGTDSDWTAVSAGDDYTLALKVNGTLWGWGKNWYGQLGNGTTQNRVMPESLNTVMGSTNPIVINNGAGSTNNTTVTLSSFAWDTTSGAGFMKCSNDEITWSVPEPYASSKAWNIDPGDGSKTVYCMFQDLAGNWSSVYSSSIVLDTIAPAVTITSPIAGLTDNDRPLLSFTTSDGVVAVKLDGIVINKVSGDTLGPLASGSHTLRLETTDTAGNISVTEVIFDVPAGVPSVSITSPIAGLSNSNTPLLTFTVSDGTVVVTVDGAVSNKVSGDMLDAIADGTHTVRVEATNASGSGFAEVVFTVDTTSPAITISSPSAGATNNKTPVLTYTVSDGAATVKLDGVVINKFSGNTLDTLTDGSHTVRVEAVDIAGNVGSAEVTFTVDTVAPVVTISSPVTGVTNLDTLPLIYAVSDGNVVVKLDGSTVNKLSGDTLDALVNGGHTVRVEATDTAGNIGSAQVDFTVDTASSGSDETNPYCNGSTPYLVGPSSFTNGITVPSAGSGAVLIASPMDGSTVNGPRIIVKGAMDTTIPINGVVVKVNSQDGTETFRTVAQVNGPYFAAQLQVTAETGTITVIATDQNNVQHQASASVMVNMLPDSVQLTASPGTGIMTVKQQTGRTTLDVLLAATASISNTVTSYAWDFSGSGSNNLTCYSHSNVTASYQEIGLYLAQVTIRDSSGNEYRDNVIVNVVDSNEIDNICTAIWNNMKTALLAENIEGALGYFVEVSRDKYGQIFTELGSANINSIFTNITELRLSSRYGKVAQYWALRVQPEGTFAYPVTFVQDENGLWKLMGF